LSLYLSSIPMSQAGLGKYCGDWIPLNWTTVPKSLQTDVIQVFYLASPLLYCDYLNEAVVINGYHGAIAFLNTRTNQSWNLNYDAWPTFPGAIIPHITKFPNGSADLTWTNFGGVFIYEGINLTYWHTIHDLVATMNGDQFNTLIEYLPFMNKTMPFYNLLSVYQSFPDKPLFLGFECFQWSFTCLAEIQRLGGVLVEGTTHLKQSLIALYSHSVPQKVDYNDPAVRQDLVTFYETMEDGWKDVGIVKFFEELWNIAIGGRFYVYDNTDYYLVQLSWPYMEFHWYPMKIPIVPPNGTEFYYNGQYHKLK